MVSVVTDWLNVVPFSDIPLSHGQDKELLSKGGGSCRYTVPHTSTSNVAELKSIEPHVKAIICGTCDITHKLGTVQYIAVTEYTLYILIAGIHIHIHVSATWPASHL